MPNRKQAHSWIPPGKKAIVRLKNGEMFIDKFRRNEKGWLYFDEHKISLKELQMMSIYRPTPERENADEIIVQKLSDSLSLDKNQTKLLRKKLKGGQKEIRL